MTDRLSLHNTFGTKKYCWKRELPQYAYFCKSIIDAHNEFHIWNTFNNSITVTL